MHKLSSFEELQSSISEVRSLHLGFITNFFPDYSKHKLWIDKGHCSAERVGNSLFIVKDSCSFWNVYFCSTGIIDLGDDLRLFLSAHHDLPLLFDVVGRQVQSKPIIDLFESLGGKLADSLMRMSRVTDLTSYSLDGSVRSAECHDLPLVSEWLHTFFDEKTEQIPYDEELSDSIRQGHVLICKESGEPAGLLIFDINASTLYLRYWFTHPDYRNHQIGSKLFRRFLQEGVNTKRQILWVKCANDNAIVRYHHYGFVEEDMYDNIIRFY